MAEEQAQSVEEKAKAAEDKASMVERQRLVEIEKLKWLLIDVEGRIKAILISEKAIIAKIIGEFLISEEYKEIRAEDAAEAYLQGIVECYDRVWKAFPNLALSFLNADEDDTCSAEGDAPPPTKQEDYFFLSCVTAKVNSVFVMGL